MEHTYACPACGYDGLYEPPYGEDGYGSYEICPCCGFQFGLDDGGAYKKEALLRWRANWIEEGFPWFSRSRTQPEGWAPPEAFPRLEEE